MAERVGEHGTNENEIRAGAITPHVVGGIATEAAIARHFVAKDEHEKGITYPDTIARRVEVVRSTQQPEGSPFYVTLALYEPWHRDARVGVEQFGVLDITPEDFDAFNDNDKQTYARHFYGYLHRIDKHIRIIGAAHGDVTADPTLKTLYGVRTQNELIEYMSTLRALKEDLEQTGLPGRVRSLLEVSNAAVSDRAKQNGRKALAELQTDIHEHGHVRVGFVESKPTLVRY